MLVGIYTVFDSAAEAYLQPFFMPTDAMAERAFNLSVNDPKHNFSKSPGDYALYSLGFWDDQSASITEETQPRRIISGNEVVTQ